MYSALGEGNDTTHYDSWTTVLRHWATAMAAGYKLHATPADRATFRQHAWEYVEKKAAIRSGATVWYDWQLYSALPQIFDTYGSLRLISQEGMEATQKRMNMLLRLGCNFANVGRIPWKVYKAGRAAVKAYLEQRRKKMKTPEEWLWNKNFMRFAAENEDVLVRVDGHRRAGRTVDWLSEHVPEVQSFVAISIIYRILVARARFNRSFFSGARAPRWRGLTWAQRRTAEQTRSRAECASPRRVIVFNRREAPIKSHLVGHNFRVTVYDTRRESLVSELAAYYAPVPCQSEPAFEDRHEHIQRKEVQRQRRARWAKRQRSALWVAHPDRMDTQ
jgi:hypothetical protein